LLFGANLIKIIVLKRRRSRGDSLNHINGKFDIEGKAYSLLSPVAVDVSLFGAKAANLAKAAQLGFKVPEGLAISRLCNDDFAIIAQEIIDGLHLPLAVRSSGVNEDSATTAFAGAFETKLGVRSTADLVDAFTKVKNSGDLVGKGYGEIVPPEQIAVLVQRMVNATRAGVAFSRDPNTGEPKVIIDSNYGLGKSVVDGAVTPDSIEYTSDGLIKTFVGRKSIKITLSDTGIHEQNTSPDESKLCSLSDAEIKEIAELAQKVERDLEFPADIEWAFDTDGVLWLLQARPITTI